MPNFIKPILFRTKNNISYFYDDVSQQVFHLSTKKEISDIKMIISEGNTDSLVENSRIFKLKERYNLFYRSKAYLDLDNIITNKKKKGIRQLTLEVTANCNLRCKYCIFSDYYSNTRKILTENMSEVIAIKAVDYFFSYNIEALKSNPVVSPVITFYGGEPLLNFKLIKKVIDYSNENYKKYFGDIIYSITTNGTLLDNYIINYLIDNDVATYISLDGIGEAHDRNRVNINNQGTFLKVIEKIKLFIELEKQREYVKNKFHILCVYDFKDSILKRIVKLSSNNIVGSRVKRISFVDQENTTFFKHFDFNKAAINSSRDLWCLYTKYKNENVRRIVETLYSEYLLIMSNRILHQTKVTKGCCIPGYDKLYVSFDGKFHACEKCNNHHPIGSIETGIEYSKVKEHLQFFYELHNTKCYLCEISNLCDVCYKHFETNGSELSYDEDICNRQKIKHKGLLSLYYSKKEIDLECRL